MDRRAVKWERRGEIRNPSRLDRIRGLPTVRRVAEQALASALGTIGAAIVLGLVAVAAGLIPRLPRPLLGMVIGALVMLVVIGWSVLSYREPTAAEVEARLAALEARYRAVTGRFEDEAKDDL